MTRHPPQRWSSLDPAAPSSVRHSRGGRLRTLTVACLLCGSSLLTAVAVPLGVSPPEPPRAVHFGAGGAATCVPAERNVTVLAVGDVLLHDSVQRWAAAQPQGLLPAFRDVQALVAAADVAVANLEGPAAEGVAPGGRPLKPPPNSRYDSLVYQGYPMFNYHPRVLEELALTGFDVLQTANNHALDRAGLGVDRTLEAIDAAGLQRTGTRHSRVPQGPWYAVREVRKGERRYDLAFLACTYGTNGLPDPARQVLLCYEHKEELLQTIRSLRSRSDIHAVIVLPHWGVEYQNRPDARQRSLAQEMADAGATAIIGTHPHVVQPLARLEAADGRPVAVAWSLGNFISHQLGLERLSAAVLGLALSPGGSDGKLLPTALGWVPIRTRTAGGYAVQRLQGLDEATARPAMEHLLRHLPRENLHPGTPPWWADRMCPSPRSAPTGG